MKIIHFYLVKRHLLLVTYELNCVPSYRVGSKRIYCKLVPYFVVAQVPCSQCQSQKPFTLTHIIEKLISLRVTSIVHCLITVGLPTQLVSEGHIVTDNDIDLVVTSSNTPFTNHISA